MWSSIILIHVFEEIQLISHTQFFTILSPHLARSALKAGVEELVCHDSFSGGNFWHNVFPFCRAELKSLFPVCCFCFAELMCILCQMNKVFQNNFFMLIINCCSAFVICEFCLN